MMIEDGLGYIGRFINNRYAVGDGGNRILYGGGNFNDLYPEIEFKVELEEINDVYLCNIIIPLNRTGWA